MKLISLILLSMISMQSAAAPLTTTPTKLERCDLALTLCTDEVGVLQSKLAEKPKVIEREAWFSPAWLFIGVAAGILTTVLVLKPGGAP